MTPPTATPATGKPMGANPRKRPHNNGRPFKKRKIQQQKKVSEGAHEEVLLADIRQLLAAQKLDDSPAAAATPTPTPAAEDQPATDAPAESSAPAPPQKTLPQPFTEIDLTVKEISSTGDGLAFAADSDHVYVVPFTAPGDTVTAKVIKHFPRESYTLTDFVRVITPSPQRDDSRIGCKYFATCSGCQFQMLSYEDQLAHKKTIVEKAYRNFSGLRPDLIPTIGETMGSPLQYGYRTKLTPHFDGPPENRSKEARRNPEKRKGFDSIPPIGFMRKGTRFTIDIEDCPIGTDAVRMGMKSERVRVSHELDKYKRGATLLLRESTERVPKPSNEASTTDDLPSTTEALPDAAGTTKEAIIKQFPSFTERKTCITDNNATSTEYVGDFLFNNPAGAFFQNNNSILPSFTQYIRDQITSPSSSSVPKPKYFIDAYCGSGLFTIVLSSLFESSLGIDISTSSIECARENAKANNIPNATFMASDAPALFAKVTFPPDETVVVIDPPRKGCDESFLKQLVQLGPARVVYVSCNVHTQARDVGYLVGGVNPWAEARGETQTETETEKETQEGMYEMESLRGFDFFPQTGHVEGVAVLRRRK
ncbi:S-adenosyl-L-methionine-dependent methyltransferase [Xylona heveae TC161]|uniref:tRNA (uracil(54)-C(5))-methyltransferase n=1 Tax=Xylona heveae (strain CBS 132557 / TC161) TaxID=1328760 RepID=A0A164ZTH3_XYLHT|nr:S-adenosyl-L-methionine-dependent methyltransferase [Xylona heveae TC161]KZF19492.1 S-adenosyl-L-methionine-dependent methyltransferase [Xylona heveae TC161]